MNLKWSLLKNSSAYYRYKIDENNGIFFQWTDLINLFSEKLNSSDISKRFSDLNEGFEFLDENFNLNSIGNKLKNDEPANVDHTTGDILFSKFDEFFDCDVFWKFECKKQSNEELFEQVTKEMTKVAAFIIDYSNQLEELLKKKESETSRYFVLRIFFEPTFTCEMPKNQYYLS